MSVLISVLLGLVLFAAVVGMLVTTVWFYVRAFEVGVWWGIGSLLFPLAGLAFMVAHWNRARDPVKWSVLSIVAAGVSMGLSDMVS